MMTLVRSVAATACLLLMVPGAEGQDIRTSGLQLDGTWLITVARPDATFNTLLTFFSNGAVMQSSALNPRGRGTAHGHWVCTGDREFLTTFWFLRFDPDTNQFLGTTRVTQRIRLNEGMNEYKASGSNQALDLQGNASGPAILGSETARRLPVVFVAELPAPPQ